MVDWETLAETEKLTHIRINRKRASMYYSLGKRLDIEGSGVGRVTELYRIQGGFKRPLERHQ